MNKKYEKQEIDMPLDDIACWEKYPKYRWMYELTRLLDSQNVKWSPFETEELTHRMLNIDLETKSTVARFPGFIYVEEPVEIPILAEVFLIKGEIKHSRFFDMSKKELILNIPGEIELKINAFTTMHFSKFTGVYVAEIYGTTLYRIRLKPYKPNDDNIEIKKLLNRIYKKNIINSLSNGLTDRVLRETVAT